MTASFDRVAQRLARINQSHLLNFFHELKTDRQRALLEQLDAIDLESIPALADQYVVRKPAISLPKRIEPAPYYPLNEKSPAKPWDRAAARAAGESLIRRGKVAAFVVAGGQGSRLGFDGPKGCFPAGPVTKKPLFQIFAEGILATQRRYGAPIPWYVMTSPLNHEQTVGFFRSNNSFGLDPSLLRFFQQGVSPSFDIITGKVLLAAKDEVATNPDGHGGSVRALHASGALDDMRSRGVEHLSYFQVDNPLVRVIDPDFIGLHAAAPDSSAQMSSKMVRKTGPDEKVGVFCLAGGKTEVIEYSDMPAELSRATNPDGSLKFVAGSIAIHVIGVEFLTRLATDPSFGLPWHRAEKKVPCIDPKTGEPFNPTSNNAVKLEKFIFDALTLCDRSIVVETDRAEEFAPIKNAAGVDSVESSSAMQSARAARWLDAAGVKVPRKADGSPDCVLELSPLTALDPADLKNAKLPAKIDPGQRLAL
ncbi:MAG TPA: UDPGP type 1 family protein [Phycisphaerales bacterium]|nr:UDPGP type 1 family protein [Phycisphaerales bacterium]